MHHRQAGWLERQRKGPNGPVGEADRERKHQAGGTQALTYPNGLLARLIAVLLLVAFAASSCSSSVTIDETATDDVEADEDGVGAVPTAAPTAMPVPAPTETAAQPTATPEPEVVPPFRLDAILGLSNDGNFGYAATTTPWNDATSCVSEAAEALAVLDVAASIDTEPTIAAGGLRQAGDIRQISFGPDGVVAVVSTCVVVESVEDASGAEQQLAAWIQRADVGSTGQLINLSAPIKIDLTEGQNVPYLMHWVDGETIEARVVVGRDDEDYEDWTVQQREVLLTTGTSVVVAESHYFDDPSRESTPSFVSPDGRFTYSGIDDPAESLGCEGYGVAAALEVSDGEEVRLALGPDGLVFSSIDDLHFGPDGLVSWTTGCEGYRTAYVGRAINDGTIIDAHYIDFYELEGLREDFVDYQHFRLRGDGHLVAMGARYDNDGNSELRVVAYDLTTDPQFVESVRDSLVLNPEPLSATLDGSGNWFVGDTLAADTACGAKTLYGETSTGLARGFSVGTELDEIVDMAVSETRTVFFEDNYSYETRAVVLLTECPGEYSGRRVWFGEEREQIRYGLYLEQADIGEVAEVLSVRQPVSDGSSYSAAIFAEVVLLDGTVVDVELVAALE